MTVSGENLVSGGFRRCVLLLLAALSAPAQAAAPAAVDADLLLRGGTIYDGSGQEGAVGDVAVRGEKIVAVGHFRHGKIARAIDCAGLVVAPGFIDLHTHSDGALNQPAARQSANYLLQGCTSVVTGNCGGGPTDVEKFYAAVDREGFGTNVLHLVPHGSVRRAVMKNANRPPTPDELKRMEHLVEQGMRQGAWGLSTGLIYVPSLYAQTDELVALAKVVSAHGGLYVSHIRSEGDKLLDAVREAIEIGRQARLPVHISHFKSSGKANWGRIREAAQLIEAARNQGIVVTADQYPYTASSTGLSSTVLSATAIPGGLDNLYQRMEADPSLDRLVRAMIRNRLRNSAKIVMATCPKQPQYVGKSIRQIADEAKADEVDVALDILRRGGGYVINHAMSEEDVRYGMTLPWVATGSDGSARAINPQEKPHPRNFGAFARKVGRYAIQEKVLGLAQAIRSSTGLAADTFGLTDRGYLRPGAVADVVVFDPKQFRDRATYEEPQQYAAGVRYVLIAGRFAVEEGRLVKTMHGRALRRAPTLAPPKATP